jgi:hypothetical protein
MSFLRTVWNSVVFGAVAVVISKLPWIGEHGPEEDRLETWLRIKPDDLRI